MEGDTTICLDDDVFPLNPKTDFVAQHEEKLISEAQTGKWFNQILSPNVYPRGFPIDPELRKKRRVVLNMGLWKLNPDLSAFEYFKDDYDPMAEMKFLSGAIPYGQYFCLSSMNVSFNNIISPSMYHMYTGTASGVYRYDDVWAGLFSKKIADHLGYSMTMGDPMVVHNKKSNEKKSLQKEIYGMTIHEKLWKEVDQIKLSQDNFLDCYVELSGWLQVNENKYVRKLGDAMRIWTELF